jgi:hypothetical protein
METALRATTQGASAPIPDRLLTEKEAAERIGVCTKAMSRLRVRGEGPPVTHIAQGVTFYRRPRGGGSPVEYTTGGVIRYRESLLDQWLVARTRGGVAGISRLK